MIYFSNITQLSVVQSSFVGCNSTINGGAIYSTAPTSISGCTFKSNGAVGSKFALYYIYYFIYNYLTVIVDGGAIYLNTAANSASSVTISNSIITDNTATNGAGLYLVGDYASITGTNITSNSASANGGGLVRQIYYFDLLFITILQYLQANMPNTAYPLAYNFVGSLIADNTALYLILCFFPLISI